MLIVKLLLLTSVSNELLDHIKVHKRLSTEEIDLQILSASRVRDQEIQSLLSCLVGHQCPASMIFAFFCKAILTCKVTIMCDVQTQRLHDCRSLLEIKDMTLIHILREQFFILLKLLNLIDCFFNLRLRILILQLLNDLIRCMLLKHRNDVISHIIHYVDGS